MVDDRLPPQQPPVRSEQRRRGKQVRGRWNHKGTAVIYAAAARSLCALEVLASGAALADDYVVTPIEIPEGVNVESISVEQLPSGWAASEHSTVSRDLGTEWVRSKRTVALCVPSAVIPNENNYILNPAHPDFSRLNFREPEPFSFDPRLKRA